MVSKSRLAGFVDAVIAVVMTVMLLEFHTPKSVLILDFLRENLVYMIAYLLSFIYVTTSWFNQQYMLASAERVTRKMYIATMLWVLNLSMLPVLAAWTGQTMNLFDAFGTHAPKAPALLFMLMIGLWGVSFVHMGHVYIHENPKAAAQLTNEMNVLSYLRSRPYWGLFLLFFGLTTIYPFTALIWTGAEMGYAIYRSHNREK